MSYSNCNSNLEGCIVSIVGISGKKSVGKDEFYKTIATYDPQMNWQNKKYAYKLKLVASILTGYPVEKFEDPEFKMRELPEQWNKKVAVDWDQYGETTRWGYEPMTVREFLQKLGTESIRTGLHPQAWINALFADYNPKYKYKVAHNFILNQGEYMLLDEPKGTGEFYETVFPNWIITDVRFPNEAKAIRERGGYLIRVDRPSLNSGDEHASETSLDDWEDWDAHIINGGSLEQYHEKIIKVYKNLNLDLNKVKN